MLLAAHALTPIVHRWLSDPGRPLLWLFGQSGQLKTALIRAAALALYGPKFTAPRADGASVAKWDSTANGLTALAYTYTPHG